MYHFHDIKDHLVHLPETHAYQSVDHVVHNKTFWLVLGVVALVTLLIWANLFFEGVASEEAGSALKGHFMSPVK